MKNRKIVLINDKRRSFGDLEEILVISGHELIVINDALSAIDIVVRKEPDVILLELEMPGKNGFELADEINYAVKTRRTPIITMSSFINNEFGFLFDLCGINKHLKKPFNPLDIIWAIENAVEENNPPTPRRNLEKAFA